MKKFFNILTVGTLVGTSVITVTACSKKKYSPYDIIVQHEKDWKPLYQKVAGKINQEFENEGSKFRIKLKEVGTFDEMDTLDKKGFTDRDLSDVFLLPFDRLQSFVQKKALATVNDLINSIPDDKYIDLETKNSSKFGDNYYGVVSNIETLVAVYNNNVLNETNIKRNLEDMTIENQNNNKPIYGAVFGDLWYASLLYNTLVKDADKSLVYKNSKDGYDTVFDYSNEEYQRVAEASFDFAQTLDSRYFDVNTRHQQVETNILDERQHWTIIGPWDANKYVKHFKEIGGKIKIDPISKYYVNNQRFSHFKGGFTFNLNARLDKTEKDVRSKDLTKKQAASRFVLEIIKSEYAVDWYNYAGKISPYHKGYLELLLNMKDVDLELIKSVVEGYKSTKQRPIDPVFSGFWGVYETNYNSKAKPDGPERASNGLDYAKGLSESIRSYINEYIRNKD